MTKILELQVDIPNPARDGRSKEWNKQRLIPKGTRFIVGDGTIRVSLGRSYSWESDRSTLGMAIVARSKEVAPESVRELASVYNCDFGADEILRIMLKLGRVKPEDFAAVAEIATADENF